ncbi:Umecyanin like [Actinidia chinensis var. chinensis]|uniref:Umecyanin like n=1 Tax=Actinidia chinensis var. chinensis TaxID=1590841 RepID=A0A2R6P352_ACTCC|nr:Umecyanin like [Actinidia chinensis var. chinensis]
MATKSNFATLVLVVATVMAVLKGGTAKVYFVGDSLGWTVPSGGAAVYANWSSQHNFTTGDILVFNFVPGQHDVAKVTKDAFDKCNSTSPISLLTLSPANFTLSAAGEHHFICTFGQHCLGGQKLSVSVSSTSSSPPPASPPTTSPSMAPSPTPSAATSPPPQSPPTTSPSPSPSMAPSPAPSAATSPPPQSPATSPSPTPSATPPAGTTSPPPPPATASMPSPPSETTLTPPPPPSSAPRKVVAATLTIMSIALGVMF